ncbi:DUF6221 family protein [Streptomyces sp. NPDC001970]
MEDLVQFLRARLAEDEYEAMVAVQRAPGPWRGTSRDEAPAEGGGLVDANGDGIAVVHDRYLRLYMARRDPARDLREVRARQRIVERCAHWDRPVATNSGDALSDFEKGERTAWLHACFALALPYAGHPAYREEWREESRP